MGMALEWLNPSGCRSLAMDILKHPKEDKGEIWAHCPFHQEKTPGGAFSYNYSKDQAKCQSCGGTGDLITVYCAVFSLPEDDGFLEFKNKYATDTPYQRPAQGTGRKAQGEKQKNYFEQVHEQLPAPAKWIERATSFVNHSFDRLIKSEKSTNSLQERWGIDATTVLHFGFGMNDQDKWIPVTSWGLPFQEHKGKEKKIWLPKGLVMPCFVNGEVRKVKIRRPDPPKMDDSFLRYVEVLGGENYRFHHYRKVETPGQASLVVVIEAERDAALVYQECARVFDDSLVAIAGGGAAKRPHDDETLALLRGADVILVAMDTDGPGAANALNFWSENFGYAKYWPVPKKYGKDVGEAFKKGLDVCTWVRAGLPEYLKVRFAA